MNEAAAALSQVPSSASTWAWRVVRGGLIGMAAHGLLALGLLGAGASVWPGWLPACVLAGIVAAPVRDTVVDPRGAPRGLVIAVVIVLAAVLVALAFGALATPARHWDGFVAWEMRARVLTEAPTLLQPYFTDHAVFAQSRDYPLVQPLWQASLAHLLGSGGRALFPSLWAALLATLGLALRRGGWPGRTCWLAVAGLGLMPMLVTPTSGAVDSGYGETAILLALTAAGAGLVLRDGLLLGAACTLAVVLKPEGTIYALVVTAAAWWSGERRLVAGAALGSTLALAVWLPVRTFLAVGPAAAASVAWTPRLAALTAVTPLLVWVRPSVGRRPTIWLLAGAAAVVLATAAALGSDEGALGGYLHNLRVLPGRLARVPALLAALCQQALALQRFGLLWPLLALAPFAAGPRATRPRGLGTLLALGLAVVCASMLLSPEEDFDHHVRSSLDRLLLQWTGPSVLLIATWLGQHAAQTHATQPAPSQA
ncbi:MAG: hypothetical protein R3F56_20840 [Planctomycetota bacterium]